MTQGRGRTSRSSHVATTEQLDRRTMKHVSQWPLHDKFPF